MEHIRADSVQILECDSHGIDVASLVILQTVFFQKLLHSMRNGGVSELRHGRK